MTANTGTPPLAGIFDGLAFGWRATGSTASTMDVNFIIVTCHTTTVSISPPVISYNISGPLLTLSWPTNHPGWLLQSNPLSLTASNWSTVPNSGSAINFSITLDPAQTKVFYRLVSP